MTLEDYRKWLEERWKNELGKLVSAEGRAHASDYDAGVCHGLGIALDAIETSTE